MVPETIEFLLACLALEIDIGLALISNASGLVQIAHIGVILVHNVLDHWLVLPIMIGHYFQLPTISELRQREWTNLEWMLAFLRLWGKIGALFISMLRSRFPYRLCSASNISAVLALCSAAAIWMSMAA